jgi:hypothetical protein
VDTFQLAVFHGLMRSKEQNIYGSDDGDDERNACTIQKFDGILAKQLLLMGEDNRRKQRSRRRFKLRGGRTQLFPGELDDFLSSKDSSSVAGGFAVAPRGLDFVGLLTVVNYDLPCSTADSTTKKSMSKNQWMVMNNGYLELVMHKHKKPSEFGIPNYA